MRALPRYNYAEVQLCTKVISGRDVNQSSGIQRVCNRGHFQQTQQIHTHSKRIVMPASTHLLMLLAAGAMQCQHTG